MALNFSKHSSTFLRRGILIVLVIVCLALITFYAREGAGGLLHQAQEKVSGIVAPVESAGGTIANGMANIAQTVENATASDATLSELRDYNAELIAYYAQSEEYRKEAERLRELLALKDQYRIEGVGARVIGRSAQAWSQTITIDKGSNDGIDSGQTVMGANGVVGQIVGTTATTATVRLLTDPESGAAAIVQSTRDEGIVRGSLNGLLYLEGLPADSQVEVGDVVLTSGLGGSYTRGLLIGTVVRVSNNPSDVTRQIIVSANDTASMLEEVIVVFSAKGSSLLPASDGSSSANNSTTDSDSTNTQDGSDTGSANTSDGGYDTSSDMGYDPNATGGDGSGDIYGATTGDTSGDAGYDPNYDPTYDPNAATGDVTGGDTGYDPNYDPNYDPYYDPNYDPNAGGDYTGNGSTDYVDPNAGTM